MHRPLALKSGSYTCLGYRAAEVERASGRPMSQGGSADQHARYDRAQLVRQSQAFDRDNGIYEGVINRAVDNILGEGFGLQARTDSARFNAQAEQLWQDFWEDPEVRGVFSGFETESIATRALFVDGDFAVIKTDPALTGGKIQLIESERITWLHNWSNGKARVEQGVRIDSLGRPTGFYIADYNTFGQVIPASAKLYSAEDVIFVANLKRASQTRGVPALVTNFPMFHRIADVCDSEAVAWQLLSRMAIAVLKKSEPEVANQLSEDDPAKIDAGARELGERIQDFDYGMIFHGEPGEEIKGIERNVPGSNFTASVTMFLRLLGLPVGFPLELILLDWSKTNYSSARAALEQAFRMFTRWQRRLKRGFYAPIYRWKIQQWIDEGRLPNRSDAFAHEWISPSFPWIDQLKEAEAWGMRIDRGLSTHAEACKSLNKDRGDWLLMRRREIEESIQTANEVNAKYPNANVDWRQFAGMAASAVKSDGAPEKPAELEDKNDDGNDGANDANSNAGAKE